MTSIADNEISKKASKLSVLKAKTATNATSAINASNATNATTAANANALGGQAPGAFLLAANLIRTGLVTTTAGTTKPMATFGPFTMTLNRMDAGASGVDAFVTVSSSENNSVIQGTVTAANTPADVTDAGTNTIASTGGLNMSDYVAPSGKTYQGLEDVGDNSLGDVCWGNSLIGAS